MRLTLIYAATFTLIAAALIPANSATARTDKGNSPHVDSAVQFPQTKWRIVRHTIRLHVPQKSSAVSQVILDVPVGLTVSNNIILSDSSGQKINANVSINGRKVTLAFPQPIAPETKLDIDLNNVKVSGVSNAWLYRVSALFVGLDRELPLGVAHFKVY